MTDQTQPSRRTLLRFAAAGGAALGLDFACWNGAPRTRRIPATRAGVDTVAGSLPIRERRICQCVVTRGSRR